MQKFQAASNHANKAACVAKRSGEAKTSEAKTSRSCPTKRQPENKKIVFKLKCSHFLIVILKLSLISLTLIFSVI